MSFLKIGGFGLEVCALAIFCLMVVAPPGRAHDKRLSDAFEKKRQEFLAIIEKMRECAKACSDCQRECDDCGTWCSARLLHVSPEVAQNILKLQKNCQDCATCCAAASQIISRGSEGGPYSGLIAKCSSTACGRCARVCESFPDYQLMDDRISKAVSKEMIERTKQCAEECRKCEKALKFLENRN